MTNPIDQAWRAQLAYGPIKSIRVYACMRNPVMVQITWASDAGIWTDATAETGAQIASVDTHIWSRRPDTWITVERGTRYLHLDDIESDVLASAWQTGAVDVCRYHRAPKRGAGGPDPEFNDQCARYGFFEWHFLPLLGHANTPTGKACWQKWTEQAGKVRLDGSRNMPTPSFCESRLYALAKKFEASDDPSITLCLVYDFKTSQVRGRK